LARPGDNEATEPAHVHVGRHLAGGVVTDRSARMLPVVPVFAPAGRPDPNRRNRQVMLGNERGPVRQSVLAVTLVGIYDYQSRLAAVDTQRRGGPPLTWSKPAPQRVGVGRRHISPATDRVDLLDAVHDHDPRREDVHPDG